MTEHEWQGVAEAIRDAWPRCDFSQSEANAMKGLFIRHDAALARRVIERARLRHDTGTLAIGVMGEILRAELQQKSIDDGIERRRLEAAEAERNAISLADLAKRGAEVWDGMTEAEQSRAREVMSRSYARFLAKSPRSLFFLRTVALCDREGMFEGVIDEES